MYARRKSRVFVTLSHVKQMADNQTILVVVERLHFPFICWSMVLTLFKSSCCTCVVFFFSFNAWYSNIVLKSVYLIKSLPLSRQGNVFFDFRVELFFSWGKSYGKANRNCLSCDKWLKNPTRASSSRMVRTATWERSPYSILAYGRRLLRLFFIHLKKKNR